MKTKTQNIFTKKNITHLKNKDLFEYVIARIDAKNNGSTVIVPHVCNNINAFGAGFAGAVASRYPIVKENYHLLGPQFLKNNLGYTQYIDVYSDKEYGHKLIFANMISQNGLLSNTNPRPINYLALAKCMASISKYILSQKDNDNPIEIHCPKFGAGLAGGNWSFINNLIEDIWNTVPVFVYSL